MHADMSSGMGSVFTMIFLWFSDVISWMDGIIIYGGFSVLDFNIALIVMGIVITVTISTAKSISSRAGSVSVKRSKEKK